MLRPLPLFAVLLGGWLCSALLLLGSQQLTPRLRGVLSETTAPQVALAPRVVTMPVTLPAEFLPDMSAVMPAAGDEANKDGAAPEGRASVGDGKGKATKPEIPLVKIGGFTVTTLAGQNKAVNEALLGPGLREVKNLEQLNRRFKFTPYAHNPTRGPDGAGLTLVEFNDLSCGQCRKDVKMADTVYTSHTTAVRQVSVHLKSSFDCFALTGESEYKIPLKMISRST